MSLFAFAFVEGWQDMWNVNIRWIACCCSLLFATADMATAQRDLSRTISYQGALIERGNRAPDGDYFVTFRLYADSLGEHPMWRDNYHVSVLGGVFSVLLGSGKVPLPTSHDLDRPLWLGVELENEPELRPLSPLTAAPFALNVPDSSITTDKLAPRSITADKLAVQYVSGISVDGYSVTASGSDDFVNFKGTRGVDFTYDAPSRQVFVGTHNPVWTAPTLRENANNFPLDLEARYIRLESAGPQYFTLTGLQHSGSRNGRIITLTNIGLYPIILKHHSNASQFGNQFSLPGCGDVILGTNGVADFIYDELLGLWVFVSSS